MKHATACALLGSLALIAPGCLVQKGNDGLGVRGHDVPSTFTAREPVVFEGRPSLTAGLDRSHWEPTRTVVARDHALTGQFYWNETLLHPDPSRRQRGDAPTLESCITLDTPQKRLTVAIAEAVVDPFHQAFNLVAAPIRMATTHCPCEAHTGVQNDVELAPVYESHVSMSLQGTPSSP